MELVEPTADSQFWWVAGLGALAAVGAAAAKGRPASAVADLDSTDLEASIRSEFKNELIYEKRIWFRGIQRIFVNLAGKSIKSFGSILFSFVSQILKIVAKCQQK